MKTLSSNIIAEKNKLSQGGAWLWLIALEVSSGTFAYYCINNAAITFDGVTYAPLDAQIDDHAFDTHGGLETLLVHVQDVSRVVGGYVEANDVRGLSVRLRLVNSLNLSSSSHIVLDETYEILALEVTEQQVSFTLGHDRMLRQPIPGERFYRNNCRWVYKSAECGYSGVLPTCTKVIDGTNGCRAHDNVPRFGGFPGIPNIPGRYL